MLQRRIAPKSFLYLNKKMTFKNYPLLALLVVLSLQVNSQSLKNTSYKNQAGEKVLRLEIVLPTDLNSAWQLFTVDDKLRNWIAPVAHIELQSGGYIITNYDSTKLLSDSTSIKLP